MYGIVSRLYSVQVERKRKCIVRANVIRDIHSELSSSK